MPTYSYSCQACGTFDVIRRMADADARVDCPGCGRAGLRRYGAPALRMLDAGLRRALDAQAGSADAPHVVSAVPPRSASVRPTGKGGMKRATNPRLARLPRP